MILSFVSGWPYALQIIAFLVALVIGIFFLVKFCDIFVDSASSIAKKLHVSPMIIGLTVVAMGTSCPELAVSASDSITCLINGGNADVAMGNVVGSNICNILLVLGFSAVFTPIIVKRDSLKRDYPVLLIASALFVFFGILFGWNAVSKKITMTGMYAIVRFEGIIFILLMVAYLTYLIIHAKKHPEETEDEIKDMKLWKAIILVIVGAVGIAVGGEAVVFGAKGLALKGASALNIDKGLATSLVGLTIVAVGTSLPELVTSIVAAKKGEVDLALGNVIGSNLFNILFVLGIASTINPITSSAGNQLIVDLSFMMFITILLFALSFTGKLGRKTGAFFLLLYILYIVYLVLRTLGVISF